MYLRIVTVEAVFDDDPTEIVEGQYAGTTYITKRLPRRKGVLWCKEQLINIGWRQLPAHYDKICWIDADIEFVQSSSDDNVPWPEAVYTLLDAHPMAIGQMWDRCELMGPDDATVQRTVTSFAKQYVDGKNYTERSNSHADYWHLGFAWMATRKALEATGGLITRTLGSADRHMAMSFLKRSKETMPNKIHKNYKKRVKEWEKSIELNEIEFLVCPWLLRHYWHGSLAHRRYEERWSILLDYDFDPVFHIREEDGMEVWSDECPPGLNEAVEQYFADRQEDSTQVEPADIVTNRLGTLEVGGHEAAITREASADKNRDTANGDEADGDNDAAGSAVPASLAALAYTTITGQATTTEDPFSFYA